MSARGAIARTIARSVAPRKRLTVSQWADQYRILSTKSSARPGRWRTDANPALREPMDALSPHSSVHDVVLKWPVQFGKTEVVLNTIGCYMHTAPRAIMTALPGDAAREKWVSQKLQPMLDETPALQEVLRSTASRDSANQRYFKEFSGGLLYVEHAGSPQRLKIASIPLLIVDELEEFALNTPQGDDPVQMLNERTSAFPSTYKRLYISSAGIKGGRTDQLWDESDQRELHVACPHCGERQALRWEGLMWTPDASRCWYACQANGCMIEEHEKTAMIAGGIWIAANPDARVRGYTINCLYYQIGLGPRWLDLVREWLSAQNSPTKLKTFLNSRLAQSWEDPAMRSVKHNLVRERALPYRLREAPAEVLAITAGCDTQDDRIPVHIVGWGRGMRCWTLDYVELPGDPNDDAVWLSVTELLNRPIQHASGALMRVEAATFDILGHRTEAVKNYVRNGLITRPMAVFGAVPNNAPILAKPKLSDINFRGKEDKRGVKTYAIGTVAAKRELYGLMAGDPDRDPSARRVNFSADLPDEFFQGITAEVFDPKLNRFVVRYKRNEPLDTWVGAYAAAHHEQLRLHRMSKADWDAREQQLLERAPKPGHAAVPPPTPEPTPAPAPRPSAAPVPPVSPFASTAWGSRL